MIDDRGFVAVVDCCLHGGAFTLDIYIPTAYLSHVVASLSILGEVSINIHQQQH